MILHYISWPSEDTFMFLTAECPDVWLACLGLRC